MPTSDERLEQLYKAFEVIANDISSKQLKNQYAICVKNSIDLMLELNEQYNAVIVSTNHYEELKEEFNFDITDEQFGLLGEYKGIKIYGTHHIEPSNFYFTIQKDFEVSSIEVYKPFMSVNTK